jgi:glucokinase
METVVGIDIGGTNTVFAIIDREGKIHSKGSILTNDSVTLQDFINSLTNKIKSSLETLDLKPETVLAVGIGAPNGNYYHGTIENAVNLKWKGIIPFAELMSSKFKVQSLKFLNTPVFLTNDAKAAAIGEMVYGAAKGMKDFIVITLGTGLGSGFVVKGELMYGSTGLAGELGHVTIEPEGRQCNCGRKGCLEKYVSATGITKTVIELLEKSKEESILRNSEPETLNSKLIYEAAIKKDKIALEAFDITGRLLGKSLANTVTITSPEAIFLTGGLAKSGDFIFKPTEKYMNEHMLLNFKGSVKLLPSGIEQSNAGVYGAAALAWHELRKKRTK